MAYRDRVGVTRAGGETVAVVGAGDAGLGIAALVSAAGHDVILCDRCPAALKRAPAALRSRIGRSLDRGRRTEAERDAIMARIGCALSLHEASRAQIVIETLKDDLGAKRELFRKLEAICPRATVFVSTTSSLSITELASVLRNPERVLGMHFVEPAPAAKLVEIVSGLATHAETARRMAHLATGWGKYCVRTRSTPGFVLNRVARPFFAEALRLLQEQVVGPATLDAIMRESGGFQMGPLELMDLIGHDVDFAVTTSIFDGFNRAARFRPSVLQKELIDAGRLGRKSGRGIFDYSTGSPAPAPRQIAPQAPPDRIVVHGELGIASSLKTLVGRSGITVEQCDGDGRIEFNGLTLAMTDGRTATERACGEERSEMVLFDLALDYTTSGRIVIAPADQCGEASVRRAAGLFQAIGKSVTRIDDAPGMVVMRTVCMLANEGADAVNEGVCDVKDVDRAMRYGGVCPMGPLVWADRIGLRDVVKTLANMQRSYAEDRYRVSPLLRKKSAAGLDFYA